jgi:hypothetical protein
MRLSKLPVVALLGVVLAAVLATSAVAAAPQDPEIVLPSRVQNAINRTYLSLDIAEQLVDSGDTAKAVVALKAVRANVVRANRAAVKQLNAVPADPEAETTPGPDSVVAVLTLETTVITSLAGLFDAKSGIVVDGVSPSLFGVMNTRDSLVNAVIALDPEGAGAPYGDAMPDILPDFDDEVANFQEALGDDTLSAGGRKVLTAALAQSTATDAKVNAAFGGGE